MTWLLYRLHQLHQTLFDFGWALGISNETVALAFPLAAVHYNLCEIQMYLFSSKSCLGIQNHS